MKFHEFVGGLDETKEYPSAFIMEELDAIRSQTPYVYNIETTNRCNMKCGMCPRTTMMTRKNEDIDKQTFIEVVKQIRPHTPEEWERWKQFCGETYNVYENDMSENHFFLYIIPQVIQLHGYGDPLLDRNMAEYVRILREAGFLSYFSCNPANIDMERTYEMIDSGLNYIKYSIESVNDEEHRKVRGGALNFAESRRKIAQILQYKKEKKKNLTVVITMLDLNRANQKEDYDKLLEAFKDLDVYIYLKSEDCQWYRKDFHGTKSIHWSEICKHPWMTMTIKSNGEATMCMEDYNNEIILGNANTTPLIDIWNGDRYKEFRLQHLRARDQIKCVSECDMKLFGDCYMVKEGA
jgi:radical SAM protein with 4Fe4S-binding SPASM domain